MRFARELYADNAADVEAMGAAHWREFYNSEDFEPDTEALKDQEKAGQFVYFAMRDDDGALCGQAAFAVSYSPIFRQRIAHDVFFYVAPEHRNRRNLAAMLEFAARDLTLAGADAVFASHHLQQDLSIPIKSAGFTPTSALYLFTGE
jgi:GNAT superfamily N-acetyltransferase